MFEPCPKIDNRVCALATTSTWDPLKRAFTDQKYTYCGMASGYDNRVKALPKCWKDMTTYQQTKAKKGY